MLHRPRLTPIRKPKTADALVATKESVDLEYRIALDDLFEQARERREVVSERLAELERELSVARGLISDLQAS